MCAWQGGGGVWRALAAVNYRGVCWHTHMCAGTEGLRRRRGVHGHTYVWTTDRKTGSCIGVGVGACMLSFRSYVPRALILEHCTSEAESKRAGNVFSTSAFSPVEGTGLLVHGSKDP